MRNPVLIFLSFMFVLLVASDECPSQDLGISGVWYHGGRQTHINVRDSDHVVLTNENGDRAVGHFTGPWKIKVPGWNVTGAIKEGGNSISWSNDTVWTRYPSGKTHISGMWYHGKKPTSIEVYDNGWKFSITNEYGQTNDGYAKGSRELYIPSLGVTGHVNDDGSRITWSNGTAWTRTPEGRGPLSSPGE